MEPKREKMISRSSSVVTGLSLHTNKTFSGGFMSASGRSPTCRDTQCVFIVSPSQRTGSRRVSHHLQQDGLSLGFLLPQPLLQLLGSFPVRIVDHFVRSDTTALQIQTLIHTNSLKRLRLPERLWAAPSLWWEWARLLSHPAAPWWAQAIDQESADRQDRRTDHPAPRCGLSCSNTTAASHDQTVKIKQIRIIK